MRLIGTRVAFLLVSAVLVLGAPMAAAQGGHPMESPADYCADTPTPIPDALRANPSQDTNMSYFDQDQNTGWSPVVIIYRDGAMTGLIEFDLSGVPEDSTVSSATLQLYIDDRSKDASLTIEYYKVVADWVESETTWENASTGVPWSTPGCGGPLDRDQTPVATSVLNASDVWIAIDITTLVQDWVDTPAGNEGIFIRGITSSGGFYEISSMDAFDENKIPRLYTVYLTPTPTITPTPSITPTPTVTPTSTPFQLVSWQQEAEHGTVATPFAVKAGMGASACAYVYSEATSYDAPGVGSLSFDVQVSVPGEYYVWTRAMGLGWNNKSFFVSMDGGAPSVDRIPQADGQWDWVWQQFDENPITLTAGTHALCFAGREAGARLDYVVLTNDPAFVPPDLPICSAGPWLPLVIKGH